MPDNIIMLVLKRRIVEKMSTVEAVFNQLKTVILLEDSSYS